jgi:two-component system, OmpR family, sensor kinase
VKWYRSLYVRIAIGFVVSLAAILVVQAMLFVWVASRSGPRVPGQPPERFAETVGLQIADAVAADPSVDIARYVRDEFGRDTHQVVVVMADGRVMTNGGALPDTVVRPLREIVDTWAREGFRPGRGRFRPDGPPPLGGPDRPRGPGGPGGPGGLGRPGGPGFVNPNLRGIRPWPIVINGTIAGLVAVPPQPPFAFLLARYAPTLAPVAAGALIVGALLATLIVFGPARRRLRAVEHAAHRFGAGDLTARAPDHGGDEVAQVATAFNAMADDLEARADALAASDRVRRQLLADVSHELATPVTAMRGFLETLTMPDLSIDEGTRSRYLGILGEETSRLERIIGDLLDLARLEGGGGSFVVGDVAMAPLFERVRSRHERACADAGVRITTSIAPGAEAVEGDPDRLEQALQNLAANAVRYAPRGSAIALSARSSEGGVVLAVSDEGPAGINAAHLPHVFDRFYKAEASRAVDAPSSGSGLGLSIVKAIVERHGGRLSVASRPGRTVFELAMPSARGASARPADAP